MNHNSSSQELVTSDNSARNRILTVARQLFIEKGLKGTSVREIAKASQTNLALINYYFGSKDALFDEIMMSQMVQFAGGIRGIFNHVGTSLEEKLLQFADVYITLLMDNPTLPMFLLQQVRENTERMADVLQSKTLLSDSVFIEQYNEGVRRGEYVLYDPLHLMSNLISLCIFPFIGRPMLQLSTGVSNADWVSLMNERKVLVPQWILQIMKGNMKGNRI